MEHPTGKLLSDIHKLIHYLSWNDTVWKMWEATFGGIEKVDSLQNNKTNLTVKSVFLNLPIKYLMLMATLRNSDNGTPKENCYQP